MNYFFAVLRWIQTRLQIFGKGAYLQVGVDLHIGKSCRLWAPKKLIIGNGVYIGKNVHIEANCEIGDYCLIANRVSIIGRHDHDFSVVGFPVRYAPWVGSQRFPSHFINEKAVIETDVWIGFGAIVLTGVTIGRGSIVAAGSLISKDIPPYSIAAGVPARVIRQRFSNPESIVLHEASIRNGRFGLSERSYDNCLIEPGFENKEHTL
jgi:acetyltransferase-like isoleucine patch superfamily enzyme